MVKGINIDITFGDAQEQFRLHMEDIDKELMVLIGQNGSGKTMMLTCTWYMSFLLGVYQTTVIMTPQDSDRIFAKNVEDIALMTFDNCDQLSGVFVFTGIAQKEQDGAEFNYEFILQFENGKLVNFNIEVSNPEVFSKVPFQKTLFNSKEARLFSSYERYLDILEMTNIDVITSIDDFKKVSKLHKIYDILWFEHVRASFNKWEREGYPDSVKDRITNFHTDWPSDHDAFGPNPKLVLKEKIPYIESDTINKKISTFGSGHQAVLMTTLFL